jgi:S-adenosyl-L-methionine hydrolase (adenosine-forming)
MIFLFTDYGLEGPYIGQVKTVLDHLAPHEKVINLMADAPRNNPKASAYLLASLIHKIPKNSILFCVIDPRVGSGRDKPVILNINNTWYVGPNNGLFDIVARQDEELECWEITFEPDDLSNSFHGRDIYAPVCASIANKQSIPGNKFDWNDINQWPDNLNEVIYIDHFGNCMTGIRTDSLDKQIKFNINNIDVSNADTFADVSRGQAFWYNNSNGLLEIAMNQGSAREELNLKIGSSIEL